VGQARTRPAFRASAGEPAVGLGGCSFLCEDPSCAETEKKEGLIFVPQVVLTLAKEKMKMNTLKC
jgi:hypothetical protein